MLEKIKNLFTKAVNKLPDIRLSKANMWIIYIYGFFCALLLAVFVSGWVFSAYVNDNIDLQVVKDMFDSLTDPQVVAAVTFIAVFTVDKDKNGISDAIEEKLKKDDEEHRRYEP